MLYPPAIVRVIFLLFIFVCFIGAACQHPRKEHRDNGQLLSSEAGDSTRILRYQQERKAILALSDTNATLALSRTLELLEKDTKEDSITAKWYVLAVYLYSRNNAYERAIELGEQAVELLHKYQCKTGYAACYNNLGYGLYKTGEYQAAIQYLQRAYQMLPLERQAAYTHLACANLALCYCALGQYNTADSVLNRGAEEGFMPEQSLAFHRGIVARDRKDYARALKYFEQAGASDEALRFTAFCLAATGQFTKAQQQYQLALRNAREQQHGDEYGKTLWYLADLFQRKQQYLKAIQEAENLLKYLEQQQDTLFRQQSFAPAERIDWRIQALRLQANSWYALYQKEHEEHLLLQAAQSCEQAIAWADSLSFSFKEASSGIEMRGNLYDLYEQTIQILFEQARLSPQDEMLPERIFLLIEKSKAFALHASVRESTAEKRLLPKELFLQRKNLRLRLAQFQRDHQTDSALTVQALLRRSDEQVQRQYPALANLRKAPPVAPSLSALRQQLASDEGILEWFMGDHHLLAIGITQGELRFFHIPRNTSLDSLLLETIQLLSGKISHYAPNQYAIKAHQLYQRIATEPVQFFRQAGVKHLCIVPDGSLWQIPFDALPEYRENRPEHYLTDDFSISYAWSAAFWRGNLSAGTLLNGYYVGFAPIYLSDDGASGSLPDLPTARTMVSNAAAFFHGTSWLSTAATKATFIEKSKKAGLLHLAMHGTLNVENPLRSGLFFYPAQGRSDDALLTAAEVYNLELNAPLVVLSACNTGAGNIERGEGVMSLARAFTAAGCTSTAMTLWSVPDEATADLVDKFMRYLGQGMRKDDALASAKSAFLQDPKWIDFRHPYYWSGLMITGEVEPIHILPVDSWKKYSLIGVLLIIVWMIYLWVRRHHFSEK